MLQNASYMFFKNDYEKRKKSHLAGVKLETFEVQGIIHCATQPLRRSCVKLIVFNIFLPMKLCRWTLFKICEAGFDRKSRTLTHFIAFEEHFGGQVSRKTCPSRTKLKLSANSLAANSTGWTGQRRKAGGGGERHPKDVGHHHG